jgi:3-phosphoshikimate 1-carboxyvinyltransferase
MGAVIESSPVRELGGEPVADLRAVSSRLRATQIGPEEIPACIDEIPILCVAAAFAEGTTRITGAGELRVKESDRIAALAANLSRMGVPVREMPDGLEIEGRARLEGFAGDSWQDHRIAMSLMVAALAAEGPSSISDPSCVGISFPGVLERLAALSLR